MIVADRKKIPEIRDMIAAHKRVLLVGCGTCVTVCLAGGEREVGIIGSALRMSLKLIGRGAVVVEECTIERQCEDAFIDILAPRVADYDAIVSLGCGAGVQTLAERFPKTAVYPGLNTQFIGILESQGVWTEKCLGCGNCRLGEFAGVCPITRCAKRLLNGPCGGSRDGKCEINVEVECAWQRIYDRSLALGTLDRLDAIAAPHDWSKGIDGGPRKVIREDQCIVGLGPKAR
jgi:ferredoxin